MQRPDEILRVLQPIWRHGIIYTYAHTDVDIYVGERKRRY